MSDLFINIRFGSTHLQLTNGWKVCMRKNRLHQYAPWWQIEVYEFWPFK